MAHMHDTLQFLSSACDLDNFLTSTPTACGMHNARTKACVYMACYAMYVPFRCMFFSGRQGEVGQRREGRGGGNNFLGGKSTSP